MARHDCVTRRTLAQVFENETVSDAARRDADAHPREWPKARRRAADLSVAKPQWGVR